MSCDPDTGRLLAALAAAVPPRGRVFELGTGTGVGTAWITQGLAKRHDVEVLTVELDPATANIAARGDWPPTVELISGNALDVLRAQGTFDLIFADAPAGKWEELDATIAVLRPGGHLLVDDMTPAACADREHESKAREVRQRLLKHPDLVSVEIAWATGLILCTREIG